MRDRFGGAQFLGRFRSFLLQHLAMKTNRFGSDQNTKGGKSRESILEVAGMSGILCIRNLGFGGFLMVDRYSGAWMKLHCSIKLV